MACGPVQKRSLVIQYCVHSFHLPCRGFSLSFVEYCSSHPILIRYSIVIEEGRWWLKCPFKTVSMSLTRWHTLTKSANPVLWEERRAIRTAHWDNFQGLSTSRIYKYLCFWKCQFWSTLNALIVFGALVFLVIGLSSFRPSFAMTICIRSFCTFRLSIDMNTRVPT